jgi:hypothetical protein
MCFLNNQVVEREREEGRERELKIEERGDIYVKRYEGEMSRERHRNGGGGDRNEREIERGMKTRRRTNGERHGEKKRDSAI